MNEDISKLIGRILGSTKRKNRSLSIVEIANDIKELKGKTGGLNEVAKLVGISTGMLNQFLSVFNLPPNVQKLVKEKKIDSVALVFTLSKFPEEDIDQLIEPIIQNKITSQELKILLPFRRQHAVENILDLIERVKNSKDIKVSIIRLPKKLVVKREMLTKAIEEKISKDNIVSIEEINDSIDITITKEGEKKLRQAARENNVTLSKFIQRLLQYAR